MCNISQVLVLKFKMVIDSNITIMETVNLMDVLFEAHLLLKGAGRLSLCME